MPSGQHILTTVVYRIVGVYSGIICRTLVLLQTLHTSKNRGNGGGYCDSGIGIEIALLDCIDTQIKRIE